MALRQVTTTCVVKMLVKWPSRAQGGAVHHDRLVIQGVLRGHKDLPDSTSHSSHHNSQHATIGDLADLAQKGWIRLDCKGATAAALDAG